MLDPLVWTTRDDGWRNARRVGNSASTRWTHYLKRKRNHEVFKDYPVFDAPRNVVFSWWSSGEKLQQWSGCKDLNHCEVQMDFRVGGGFTQKMQIGGKATFTITATYDEIVVPERIVYRVDLGVAVTRVQVEFFDEARKTRMVLTQDGFPDEMSVKIRTGGTTESLDKLESIFAADAQAIR